MRTDKELGAIRVMEALSAVDEELLERCGESDAAAAGGGKSAKASKKGKTRRFVQKYAMACAACLCLAVAGAAYFGMSQIRKGFTEGSDGAKSGEAGSYSNQMAGMENAADEIADNGGEAVDGGLFAESAPTSPMEPEWLDVGSLAAIPKKDEAVAEEQEAARQEAEELFSQQTETASAPINDASGGSPDSVGAAEEKYLAVDVRVPEGYSLAETEAEEKKQADGESVLYEWSDGEHSLWLRFTQTDLTVDMRIDAEPPVYTVQEKWWELIPDAGADGYVQFALLYENGMLAEYRGTLEREELIGLMESLAP